VQYRLAIAAGDTEEALGNLAQLLEETGRTEEAEQHYRLAVAAGDEESREYLIEMLEDLGRDDDADALRTAAD
jgi:thioredoxin-like negative regulator of GroEL